MSLTFLSLFAGLPSGRRNGLGQFAKRMTGEMFEGMAIFNDQKGYACVWLNSKSVKIHILVWERANGPKPAGHEIHHKDENKGNYSLDNLELLTNSDHRRVHASWVRGNGEWIAKPCTRCLRVLPFSGFYPRKGYTPSAQCKPCHNQTIRDRLTDPGRRAANLQYKREYYLRSKGVR